MFDLDPGILFVQCFLHFSINDCVRRSPYDDSSFLSCAGVELRDRLATCGLALFLCVAAAHEEPHDNHYGYCSADDRCAFTDSHCCRFPLFVLAGQHQLLPMEWRARKSCNTLSAPSPSQKVICLTPGTNASSAPGTSSPNRRAVPTGVLPRRFTSSSAPQRINVGTLTSAAFARASHVTRAFS